MRDPELEKLLEIIGDFIGAIGVFAILVSGLFIGLVLGG